MGQEIVNFNEAWAEQAQKWAQEEPLNGGTFLSTRGGTLAFGDEQLPGNQAAVIILDSVYENTYYADKFDPDVAAAPTCYAFGRASDPEEMSPHPSMQNDAYFVPQAEVCSACPHNEWGSADKGRGKACQNRRRLALIPAGFYAPKRGSRDFDLELFDDPKHFQTADIAFIKLPVTSVKGWSKYVSQLSSAMRRPPHGVITRLYLEPDANSQYMVKFEAIEEVPDALAAIVMARADEASKATVQGYKAPEPADAAPQGSLRGLRRR